MSPSALEIPMLLRLPIQEFVTHLQEQGIHAFHIIYDQKSCKMVASHPILQSSAEFFQRERTDFDNHEGMFGQIGPQSGVLQGAFVHRTCRGAGAGGVRNWLYETAEDWFRDGMRLSKGMTHKNALAMLWWGGGKGCMARNTGVGLHHDDTADQRRIVYEEYGSFLTALRGCYVTAEDVGTSVEDMANVFKKTRFTTCIPLRFGGSGNPSVPTARGIIRGLEAAFSFLGKKLEGSRIAVQGIGHVGTPLISFLVKERVSKIIAVDVDAVRVEQLKREFPDAIARGVIEVRKVDMGDNTVLFEDVDAVSPSAVGGTINPQTIPHIRARIICGAANNQLGDLTKDDLLIKDRGIVYVPDFLVNRMGIVNCADEAAGYVDPDPEIEAHLGDEWDNSIFNLTTHVLKRAAETGATTQQVALALAEERSFMPHPIWGARWVRVIGGLLTNEAWLQHIATNT